MNLKKLIKKASASMLTLGMVATMMPMGTSLAASDVQIRVGNHSSSQNNNLYMKFTLGSLDGIDEGSTVLMSFDENVNLSGITYNSFDIVWDDTSATTTGNTMTELSNTGIPASLSEVAITVDDAANTISMKMYADGSKDMIWEEDDVIYFYLGASDECDGEDVVIGNDLTFAKGCSAGGGTAGYFVNPNGGGGSFNEVNVTVTEGGHLSAEGSYALDATGNGDDITINATLDPFINIELNQNSIDFDDLATTGSLATDSNVTVTVDTNSQTGYELYYRSTPLENSTGLEDIDAAGATSIVAPIPGTDEKWGFNSDTVRGTTSGSASFTDEANYTDMNKYAMITTGALTKFASSDDPDEGISTLKFAASITSLTAVEDYSATVTFNTYATF